MTRESSRTAARVGWVLEVSAPGGVDRFVARTPEVALRWLAAELSEWWALDLALETKLTLELTPVVGGVAGAPLDLRPFVVLTLEDLPPTPLSSRAGIARLARRIALRPNDEPAFVVDERALRSALPRAEGEPVEYGATIAGQLPGAYLADPARVLEDLDPAPPRTMPLPPEASRLFELVYAAPDDDAPRLVLADVLEEAGHPRGAFIREQVERGRTGLRPSKEEQRLLERHGPEWLAPVAGFMTGVEWERGFPVEATVTAGSWLSRPELATLRRARVLDGQRGLAPGQLSHVETLSLSARSLPGLVGASVRALHLSGGPLTVRGVPCAELASLAAAPPRALRSLEVEDSLVETAEGERLLSGPGRLLDASDWAWLWRTPLGAQLEHFAAMAPFEVLPSWLRLAQALPVPTLMLRVCQYLTYAPFRLRLSRGARVVHARELEVPEAYRDGRSSHALLEAALAQAPWLEGVSFEEEGGTRMGTMLP